VARAAILVLLAACATSAAWTESDVVFTRYSPLSRNAEIARGDRGARARIQAIDARFAGLAAPGIVALDARLTGP
jgi:hypothetical protein